MGKPGNGRPSKPKVKKSWPPGYNLKNGSWLASLNLDFEKPAPEGWILQGEGFRVQLDPKDAAGGKQSPGFTFEREVPEIRNGSFGLAACSLPVQHLAGKRLRLAAALKTRELAGEGFAIKGKVKAPHGLIPPGTYVVANKLDLLEREE